MDTDFDLDMEFIPNMEIYKDDSDDDMINEEIISDDNINYKNKKDINKITNKNNIKNNKNKIKKTCEICENPFGTNIKMKHDLFYKEFDFCKECKSNLFYLFEKKFIKYIEEIKIDLPSKKRINDFIKYILNNSIDKESTIFKINDILNETCTTYKNEIENYIPYDNIKMLDSDGNFCCFTTIKRMNKFINENSVDILANNTIKWKYPKNNFRNHEFQIKEDKMKENKCFCCGSKKFLKSLGIFPEKKSLSIFLRDNVLIHFFFAFCSKCRDNCDVYKDICNNYFYKLLNKYPDEYIEELYQNKKNQEIMDFVEDYIHKFKELCK